MEARRRQRTESMSPKRPAGPPAGGPPVVAGCERAPRGGWTSTFIRAIECLWVPSFGTTGPRSYYRGAEGASDMASDAHSSPARATQHTQRGGTQNTKA